MRCARLVMLRHGQSLWNKANLFTGWVDIPLSQEGIGEVLEAGRRIADIPFDIVFVSALIRAQMSAFLALSVRMGGKVPYMLPSETDPRAAWATIHDTGTTAACLPVVAAWQLNERMYGELQGHNKQTVREKYGEEQVHIWRRSYDVAPPRGESLAMNAERTLPYFRCKIEPYLVAGKNVLIVAHGNSLRAIVMYLDNLSKDQVMSLEIPTGALLSYTYAQGSWEKHHL